MGWGMVDIALLVLGWCLCNLWAGKVMVRTLVSRLAVSEPMPTQAFHICVCNTTTSISHCSLEGNIVSLSPLQSRFAERKISPYGIAQGIDPSRTNKLRIQAV
jgi:hypothetical protein